jgi:two-component system, LytTR family, response regulator
MLNILIVDDEPLAHDVLLHHCSQHTGLNVVGQCYNAAQALTATESFKIDLMFVDIRMPRFGGLELLRGMTAPPLTIIVSAYK